MMYRQTRLLSLAQSCLTESEFCQRFNLPSLIFATEVSDNSTVESDIRFMKKGAGTETDVNLAKLDESAEEVNNSRVFFLSKTDKNTLDGITVGRGHNNDIVINLGVISKFHAILKNKGPEWCIADADSTNGTLVNGERLEPKKLQVLRDNTKITFGREVNTRFYTPSGLWNFVNLYRGLKLGSGLSF